MRAESAWQAALGRLQMEMNKANFDTWVRDAELISYEDGEFIVGVKNAYARDWLTERLSSTVTKILTGIMNRTVQVRFIVWQTPVETAELLSGENGSRLELVEPLNPVLNTRYTFEKFVVGPSNRMAHAACLAVAEKPAHAYNPLFLYGGVGLGKTHLLHAIGNVCQQCGLQVLYTSSEEFTNDLIHAIRTNSTQAFREKYRRTDVLLVDDVQFIAGKDATQEEFFHTFNTLYGQNKQIVLSSDRPPKAMLTLEERLRSRFEWGLTADLQPPDFETRMAILRSKSEQMAYRVADDILALIAHKVQTNIRELEGALNRVTAFANLSNLPMCPDLVETALRDMLPNHHKISAEQVLNLVAASFSVPVERLIKQDRSRQVVVPRQIAMYLLREEAKLSLPQIGSLIGGRDHTTVMYGCEKAADLLERDERLRRQVLQIRQRLYGECAVLG